MAETKEAEDEKFWLTMWSDPEFEPACEAINSAWHEAFDREHAIKVLDQFDLAPTLRQALSEMTFEEWEDFIVNYLGD